MLLLVETDLPTKKKSDKWDMLWPNGANYIEIVCTLLTEIVAFYLRFPIIEI